MELQVTIENSADVTRMVQELPPELFERVQQILENAAVRIAERARELAPVRTGFLRNSIQHGTRPPSESDAAFRDIAVEAQAEYSSFVEFGTSRMEAQPFLGPATSEIEGEVLQEVETAFNSTIEQKNQGR